MIRRWIEFEAVDGPPDGLEGVGVGLDTGVDVAAEDGAVGLGVIDGDGCLIAFGVERCVVELGVDEVEGEALEVAEELFFAAEGLEPVVGGVPAHVDGLAGGAEESGDFFLGVGEERGEGMRR